MKKITLALLSIGLLGGCNTSDHCSNGQLDGDETEIDCGGECDPCLPAGTLFATIEGTPYYASSVYAQPDGNSMDVVSNGSGTVLNFEFFGLETNTYLPITGAQINNTPAQIQYYMNFSDTGSVFITHHDEVRKIISGKFFLKATGNQGGSINDGEFENVRYN